MLTLHLKPPIWRKPNPATRLNSNAGTGQRLETECAEPAARLSNDVFSKRLRPRLISESSCFCRLGCPKSKEKNPVKRGKLDQLYRIMFQKNQLQSILLIILW